ncbi:stage III sporulation protein SpoAB [Clostridium acetireducens DSM 10703]|jgi:stage III sporulation protein AB|uniref:Stage III sporulation protein SpoAB n=1 Tax=Clostridium acetireducens DSM 10703 TaxID=1121290 RepID=A0A1E8F1S5_9CLOT|nr:stage III sporulation protein SpoIIIAB [Clostridium acetireducens]OFI07588.1 stage III sporulation protein SpoAB [Clostridium acetireducens DSM 10703]
MLRVLGCILIITTSTSVGFLYAQKFIKRVEELNELNRIIHQLENEIMYTHTPLPEAMTKIYKKSKYPLNKVFKELFNLLNNNQVDSVYEAFYKALNKEKEILNLLKEDKNVILDLAKNLGESDIEGQRKMFSLTCENLKKQIKSAEISLDKNVKMYRYLGFTIGAMVIIMLI